MWWHQRAGGGDGVLAAALSLSLPIFAAIAPTISIEVFNPAFSDKWLHAYWLGLLKHVRLDQIDDLDGINTLTASGSQIIVQLSANPSQIAGFGAPVITAVLHYTRVLEIKGDAT